MKHNPLYAKVALHQMMNSVCGAQFGFHSFMPKLPHNQCNVSPYLLSDIRHVPNSKQTPLNQSGLHASAYKPLVIIVEAEHIGDRSGFEWLESVLAYLYWRRQSAMRRGRSWRNQPDEVGLITHAINLVNQAASDPTQVRSAESVQLFRELGEALEAAKAANVPKKPPQSQKLTTRRATA